MKRKPLILAMMLLAGCAGMQRSCAACNAESFGSDWVVVQYNMDGSPIQCWILKDTSITNEHSSDGIYWKNPATGHLVHISGWYNRVQVNSGRYEEAASELGEKVLNACSSEFPKTQHKHTTMDSQSIDDDQRIHGIR